MKLSFYYKNNLQGIILIKIWESLFRSLLPFGKKFEEASNRPAKRNLFQEHDESYVLSHKIFKLYFKKI